MVKVTPEGLPSWRFTQSFGNTDAGALPITYFCEVLNEAASERKDVDVVAMLKVARERLYALSIPYKEEEFGPRKYAKQHLGEENFWDEKVYLKRLE